MKLGDNLTVRRLLEQIKGGKNQHRMNKTRLSLFYLGSYLFTIGIGLLFAPRETLSAMGWAKSTPRISAPSAAPVGTISIDKPTPHRKRR